MRAWGIGFLIAAGGAVFLERVSDRLALMLVLVVAVAFVVSLVGAYADRRVAKEIEIARATDDDVAYFRGMKEAEESEEELWEALVAATTPRPLGPQPPAIVAGRLRSVGPGPIGSQRPPGAGS